MASPEVHAGLAEIDALNAALAAAAAAGEWHEVLVLDEARYTALAALPAVCFESGEPAVRRLLEQSLAVTRAVLDRAGDAQSREAGSLRELQRGHRGARAYLSTGA